MRLVDPIDFDILAELADEKRNTAPNLAAKLDRDRPYINTRLPVLADYNLLKRVGPAARSGLYEITEKGQVAVEHQEKYHADEIDFSAFIESELE